MRYYSGLDLFDVGSRRLSWRRLSSLIEQLPRESATARSVHGDVVLWGPLEHLVADLIDVGLWANWQRENEGVKRSKQTPKPKPYPRPGFTNENRTALPHGEVVRRLRDFERRASRR